MSANGTWLASFLPVVGRLQERIRQAIVPLDEVARAVPLGGPVLEIGCGEGLVLEQLAHRIPRLVGVDLDARKIARARERLVGFPQVTLHLADGFAFLQTLEKGSFPTTLLIDTLSSFAPEDQARLLAEMVRILEPGGLLLIKAIDGRVFIKTTLSRLLSGLVYRVLRLSLSHGQRFTYLSSSELEGMLQTLGCEVEIRHLHREHFHPIPHILLLARKQTGAGA